MKKFLALALAVLISLSAFVMTAYADSTKTDAIIDEILESRSLSITFDNDSLEKNSIPFKDITASVKIFKNDDGTKDIKFAAKAKLLFFDVKLLLADGEIYAYLPLISFCVSDFLGGTIDFSGFADKIDEMIGLLDSDVFDCLKVKSVGEKDTAEYGKVYVEEFVPDLRKCIDLAVKEGVITIPAGSNLATMSEAEMINMLNSLGQPGKNVLRMLDSNVKFYYNNDKLVAFDIVLYDLADDSAQLNSNDLLPIKAEYITSSVPDSTFTKPIAFDFTGIMKMILGFLFA